MGNESGATPASFFPDASGCVFPFSVTRSFSFTACVIRAPPGFDVCAESVAEQVVKTINVRKTADIFDKFNRITIPRMLYEYGRTNNLLSIPSFRFHKPEPRVDKNQMRQSTKGLLHT